MTTIAEFTWGNVRDIHRVGEYEIVEYDPRKASNVTDEEFDPSPSFHPFIDGVDTCRSYKSLDAALVGVIARKHDGINTRADVYFLRGIGLADA